MNNQFVEPKKLIPVWILINTVSGLLVSLLIYAIFTYPFKDTILFSQMLTHTVSTFTTFCGYYTGRKLKNKKRITTYLIALSTAMAGTVLGLGLLYAIVYLTFSAELLKIAENLVQFTIILAIIVTISSSLIVSTLEVLMSKNLSYKAKLDEINKASKEKQLVIKEKDIIRNINIDEIIYISAAGKRTVIHTIKEDIEVSLLLKDIIEKLPDRIFIRIHKKYIIRIDILISFEHIKSGMYQVYLGDEDETVLPVGRTYVQELREKFQLGIN